MNPIRCLLRRFQVRSRAWAHGVISWALMATCLTPVHASTLRVDATVPPGGALDGTSWANAHASLDAALAAAVAGDELWVKAGTYSPSVITTGFQVSTNVSLYGGFNGTEANLQQRANLFLNTWLDGGGSAWHVVSVTNVAGSPGVLIDGFRISGGVGTSTGGAAVTNGGGICALSTDLDLVNCLVEKNTVPIDGGGLYFQGGFPGPTNTLRIKFCEFRDNYAGHTSESGSVGDGGAINAREVTGYIENTPFNTNGAVLHGGGVFLSYMPGSSALLFANCVFWGNHGDAPSISLGGGIYIGDGGVPFTGSKAELVNCTMADNYTANCAAGQALYVGPYSVGKVVNSILFFNYQSCSPFTNSVGGLPTISYSDVEATNFPVGSTNINLNPRFRNHAMSGGLTLKGDSPCIDRADSNALPLDTLDLDNDGNLGEFLPIDLLEMDRTWDMPLVPNLGTGWVPYLDMGAYERRS